MNWLDRLERKFGRYAIPNLMSYIIFGNATIFLLYHLIPSIGVSLMSKLSFVPQLIFRGEIWRFITFIFIPPNTGLLWGVIALLFYYSISRSLESQWGAFRFNVYYLIGMLGTIVFSLIFKISGTPYYLNLSLFLAYAKMFADNQIYLFFIIPIKVKYLGWIYWALLLFSAIQGGLGSIILLAVSLANYFLFFGFSNVKSLKTNRTVKKSHREFKKNSPKVIHIHRCTICAVTDRDNPDIQFRYCSKCDGHYEYCADHIFDHDHK